MAFCITFGMHDFRSSMKEYSEVTGQCHNCGNWATRVITEWPFFTVCFVPIIPLATHKYKIVACPVCDFKQDLANRPDIQSQAHDPNAMPMQYGPPHQQQGGPNGGWQGGPPPGPGGAYGQQHNNNLGGKPHQYG